MKFDDVMQAFFHVACDSPFNNEAAVSRKTGKVYFMSDDYQEELPEDIWDNSKYISVPHWNELGMDTRLVFNFARECIPETYDKIREIFSRKGGYRRFRVFLIKTETLQLWYDYENKKQEEVVREWCLDNEISIDDE